MSSYVFAKNLYKMYKTFMKQWLIEHVCLAIISKNS